MIPLIRNSSPLYESKIEEEKTSLLQEEVERATNNALDSCAQNCAFSPPPTELEYYCECDLLNFLEIRELELSDSLESQDQEAMIRYLFHFPLIEKLTLRDLVISDELLEIVSKLKSIQCLTIDSCTGFTEMGLKHVVTLRKLTELYIVGATCNMDDILWGFWNKRQVKVLSFTDCPKWTDDGAMHLTGYRQLEQLRFSGCKMIGDIALMTITHLDNVHSIQLYDCPLITDAGLSYLYSIGSLKELSLSFSEGMSDAIMFKLFAKNHCKLHIENWPLLDKLKEKKKENLPVLVPVSKLYSEPLIKPFTATLASISEC